MRKGMKKDESRWLKVWKTIVPEPELIHHWGPYLGTLRGSIAGKVTEEPWASKGLMECWVEDGGRVPGWKFFAENSHKFLEFGIVFGGRSYGLYPWRYCDCGVALPIEFVQRMLKAEFGANVRKAEIMDMMQRGFLPKSGGDTLPLYAKDRIMLIREYRSKFGYRDAQLKGFMEYEDQLMHYLSDSRAGMSYDECDCLNIVAKRSKPRISNGRVTHRRGKKHFEEVVRKLLQSASEKLEWERAELSDSPSILDFLAGKRAFGDLTKKDQDYTRSKAEHSVFLTDFLFRQGIINFLRLRILGGFSPQITFLPQPELEEWPVDIGKARIDWTQSLENVENLDLDFVRTPMFMVEHDEGKINIRIMQPGVITSKEMHGIVEKVYNRIRDKVITGIRPWGTVSGGKAYHDERNRRYKEHFKKIKPSAKSLQEALEKVDEKMKEEGYWPVGYWRKLKLVYPYKKIGRE